VSLACISHAHVIDGYAPRSTATYRGVEVRVPHPRLRLEVVVVNEVLVPRSLMPSSGLDTRKARAALVTQKFS
jgi:hypothetical protein